MANRVARAENIARVGFLARGIVYMLLGYFAITARGTASDGTTGVLQKLGSAGTWMLVLIGRGLAAYGFVRI